MRQVTAIEPKWLTEMAPTFYKTVDASKSKRKRYEKIEPLFNKFEEKDAWRMSVISKNHKDAKGYASHQ